MGIVSSNVDRLDERVAKLTATQRTFTNRISLMQIENRDMNKKVSALLKTIKSQQNEANIVKHQYMELSQKYDKALNRLRRIDAIA